MFQAGEGRRPIMMRMSSLNRRAPVEQRSRDLVITLVGLRVPAIDLQSANETETVNLNKRYRQTIDMGMATGLKYLVLLLKMMSVVIYRHRCLL